MSLSAAAMEHDLAAVCSQFQIDGKLMAAARLGIGRINDTYEVRFSGGKRDLYVVQRINQNVFKRPLDVMENVQRVTEHLKCKMEECGSGDPLRNVLTLVPAKDGKCYLEDGNGDVWRTYLFIEGAVGHAVVDSPEQAREGARAFGAFFAGLVDLPGEPLHETIPGFHDTRGRYAALEEAIARDTWDRVAHAGAEIEFARSRKGIADMVAEIEADGQIPRRTTHGDTKLNNVLIDEDTDRAVCVIDLDTVMPGYILHDFGDMVRTFCNTAGERAGNLDSVCVDMAVFEAVVDGYLETAGPLMTPAELDTLVAGARTAAYEVGIRFLSDHLAGDVYFKSLYPGQNLERARTQMKLVESMEENEEQMLEIVRRRTV